LHGGDNHPYPGQTILLSANRPLYANGPLPLRLPVVSALLYHKVAGLPPDAAFPCNYVSPPRFAAQLAYLRRAGFHGISFRQYLSYRRGQAALPTRPIIISFDDGYRSNLEIAAPILRRHGFTATIFIVAGLLGATNEWDAHERQEPLLSASDVQALHAEGFEIQSHTLTHPRLTTIARDDALRELRESRQRLESLIDDDVSVISYPWGEANDEIRSLSEIAGYDAGVVVRRRTNFHDTPLFELRRIGVNDTTSLARFVWDLARLRFRGA